MGKYLPVCARMLPILLVLFSLSLTATGQQQDDDWIDPYDMLNYEPNTKTMRKPVEPPVNYPNVPTKRREHIQDHAQEDSCKAEKTSCSRQVEELNKQITRLSQQPSCSPVFKRFLSRLLKEIRRVGVPSDSVDVLYDAKIRLSKQAVTEIQTLLEGEDNWRTGALDNALSQILVDLRPHDYEAWKWRFEDTFGVELDTVIKIGLGVLVLMGIICTQLWSRVSWFVQFGRLFALAFFVSIVWNWFYLYQIAFAERQNNLVKLDGFTEKCTGVKRIDWQDSFKEMFRTTFTLQDDPCKKYYEYMLIPPYLLVAPTKAISLTVTTFFTEPLKHFGQGIGEFLRALLKDLPVTLQIPVLLTIVLAIVVCMYTSVQAAFVHGITAPFRRPRRDPPPPPLEQPRHHPRGIEDVKEEDDDHLAGGDAPPPRPQPALRAQAPDAADDGRAHSRNQVRQRRPDRPRQQPVKVQKVVTLRSAEPRYSGDETDKTDAASREEEPDDSAQSGTEQEPQQHREKEEQEAGGAAAGRAEEENKARSKTKPPKLDSSQSKPVKPNEKPSSAVEPSTDGAASAVEPEGRPQAQTGVQDLPASSEDNASNDSIETLGVPVQESSPASAQ